MATCRASIGMYVLCMYVPEEEDPVGARYYKSAYVCMQEAGVVG